MVLGNTIRRWLPSDGDVVLAAKGYAEWFFEPYHPPFEIEWWFEEDPSQWKTYLYLDEGTAIAFWRRTSGKTGGGYLDFSHLDLVERVIPSIAYRAILNRRRPIPPSLFDLEKWTWPLRGTAWERKTSWR
jgi:hypothetical protein